MKLSAPNSAAGTRNHWSHDESKILSITDKYDVNYVASIAAPGYFIRIVVLPQFIYLF